jgi:penicillin-binding protein 1A
MSARSTACRSTAYARERRVQLSYAEYPKQLVEAFISAEDKTFFSHHGVDFPGLARAAFQGIVSGETPRGTSTITQQVAKNLLIGNEVSYLRKGKEAILAWKIENALPKEQILELYLNSIELGRNAGGVEAASQAYFGKELNELSLPQMAYLAILPKGPANYDPERYDPARSSGATGCSGRCSPTASSPRRSMPKQLRRRSARFRARLPEYERVGGYFVEEVRRQLIDKFGEQAADGPNSVYGGGLWVRTSLDPRLQEYAQKALRDGLLRYDRGRGWSGPINHVDVSKGWLQPFLNTNIGVDYEDWRAASRSNAMPAAGRSASTTARPARSRATSRRCRCAARAARHWGDQARRHHRRRARRQQLRAPLGAQGLGRHGGRESAHRPHLRDAGRVRFAHPVVQPRHAGAAPAGLDDQAARLRRGDGAGTDPRDDRRRWPVLRVAGRQSRPEMLPQFRQSAWRRPQDMRWGVEQSRNLMTVQVANQIGMEHVVDLIQRVGVSKQKFPTYLSYALGAGETTVLRMVNAYSILVNHGRALNPTLIDFVQNRRGEVILPENWRACDRCNARDYDGGAMPRPITRARQVVEPMSAYQIVHITEGVIQRGTATTLRELGRPMMGKTGTTSGPTDVWFVGGTPQMIGGLYLGYDSPTNLGGYAQGGSIAAPIFKQFAIPAFKGMEVLPFTAPAGIRMVRIDRASGRKVAGGWPTSDPLAGVIWEAFKPESEPQRRRRTPAEEAAERKTVEKKAAPATKAPSDSDFLQRQGGIY